MKKIAWAEKFTMYVHVDFKLSTIVITSLQSAGYKAKEIDKGDDHEIQVIVTIDNCKDAKGLIKAIIA